MGQFLRLQGLLSLAPPVIAENFDRRKASRITVVVLYALAVLFLCAERSFHRQKEDMRIKTEI
jgi:hypothetical protein